MGMERKRTVEDRGAQAATEGEGGGRLGALAEEVAQDGRRARARRRRDARRG